MLKENWKIVWKCVWKVRRAFKVKLEQKCVKTSLTSKTWRDSWKIAGKHGLKERRKSD